VKQLVYMYGPNRGRSPIALVSVELDGEGRFPPVIVCRGSLYAWDNSHGGYHRWMVAGIPQIADDDVRNVR
jgi:hypothetical protein